MSMQRNAFTMIELIVVVVIIGILATVALPHFSSSRDLAKINSEISSFNSLESVVMSELELQSKRYGDIKVNWHNYAEMNNTVSTERSLHYKTINQQHLVLSRIAKRNGGFKIVGWKAMDCKGNSSYTDGLYCDPFLLEAEATNSLTGVKYPLDAPGQDVAGEPDRNDFWVFNPTPVDLRIVMRNSRTPLNERVIPSGEIALVDVNGTSPVAAITDVGLKGLTNAPDTIYYFSAPAN